MKHAAGLVAVLALVTPAQAETATKQLERVQDVGAEIRKCWRPPQGTEGQELTVTFSFKRSGEILGTPRITYSKLKGNDDLQKSFVSSVLKAISACTPLHFSDGLGGAIAGRPFAMRFVGTGPQQNI